MLLCSLKISVVRENQPCAFAFEGAYFVGLNSLNVAFIVQVLAHLLDMVFYSDEKERVIPLLVNIMHYVVPYLRNHRWICFFFTIIYYAILSYATSNANKQKKQTNRSSLFSYCLSPLVVLITPPATGPASNC